MVANINSLVCKIALQWGKMCKMWHHWYFVGVYRGGTRRQARQQQSNFVSEDTNEEAFFTEYDTTLQFARKYFANLHLANTWRENKSCEGADRLCIYLQYHSKQSPEKIVS